MHPKTQLPISVSNIPLQNKSNHNENPLMNKWKLVNHYYENI